MLEDLDALTGKLTELSARVRLLRAENVQLRSQVAASHVELAALRERVGMATQRLDALLAALPASPASGDGVARRTAA